MALNLGLESLQGKVQQAEEKSVELSDLLVSQIEFNEAYQAFIDYKNVCEIVVKAKSSTESIEFANNLLNASVKNIGVSAEALADKLKAAWQRFLTLWSKFVSWFKGMFKKAQTSNKNLNFPVEVNPSTKALVRFREAYSISFHSIPDAVKELRKQNKNFDITEELNDKEAVDTWLQAANGAIWGLNKLIEATKKTDAYLKRVFGEDKDRNSARLQIGKRQERVDRLKKHGIDDVDRHDPDTDVGADMFGAIRYILMFGPKFISKIQASINKL